MSRSFCTALRTLRLELKTEVIGKGFELRAASLRETYVYSSNNI